TSVTRHWRCSSARRGRANFRPEQMQQTEQALPKIISKRSSDGLKAKTAVGEYRCRRRSHALARTHGWEITIECVTALSRRFLLRFHVCCCAPLAVEWAASNR